MKTTGAILKIRDLSVVIDDESGERPIVHDLELSIGPAETVALVGESGSGKTLIALSVLGLLPSPPARVVSGSIELKGTNLLGLDERKLEVLRGDRIAMIFQEPITCLNPLMPIGRQITEAIQRHKGLGRRTAKQQVLALMEMVGIADPQRRFRSYPHQLSGGIRQRVLIAIALVCRPDLLLADEPTSALDSTVQAQIVDLLSRLIGDLGMSVLLITHNLGVVAAMANRVVVLHAGQVIEEGSVVEILKEPIHPYTQTLVNARPFSRDSSFRARPAERGDQASFAIIAGGCPFGMMCPIVKGHCRDEMPSLVEIGPNRKVRCFGWERSHVG